MHCPTKKDQHRTIGPPRRKRAGIRAAFFVTAMLLLRKVAELMAQVCAVCARFLKVDDCYGDFSSTEA